MNDSLAVFLMDDSVRAVAVIYEDIDIRKDTTKMAYKAAYLAGATLPTGAIVFKTLDPDIKEGDFVIVPTGTRHGMTVCKVVSVDIEIDFDSEDECHWIVGTVNTVNFEEIRQKEEMIIVAVKKAEKDRKRNELRKSLLQSLKESSVEIPRLTNDTDNEGNGKE